jgi:hypothetical protein
MEHLMRVPKWFGSRYAWGAGFYLALNFLLLAAEARWHLLYQLTVWDISELKTLALLVSQGVHH